MSKELKTGQIIRQIGRNLKHAREKKGVSIQDLAAELDLPTAVMVRIENGAYRDIKMYLLFRIMECYGMSSEELTAGI